MTPQETCPQCLGTGVTGIAPDFFGDDPRTMKIGTVSCCPLCNGTGKDPNFRIVRNAESVSHEDGLSRPVVRRAQAPAKVGDARVSLRLRSGNPSRGRASVTTRFDSLPEGPSRVDDSQERRTGEACGVLRLLFGWLPKRPSAVLSFEFPEQRVEFERAAHAEDWWLLVWDLAQELREIEKREREGFDAETVAKLREWLYDALAERGLRLDD